MEDVNPSQYEFVYGKGVVLHQGRKIAIITSGLMVQESLRAATYLKGIDPTIVNIHTIKPIDEDLIIKLAQTHDMIITIEEHTILGGLGSAVAEVLAPTDIGCPQHRLGLQDCFGRSGKPQDVLAYYQLDAKHIAAYIEKTFALQEELSCKK